jgi:hypothetical protein
LGLGFAVRLLLGGELIEDPPLAWVRVRVRVRVRARARARARVRARARARV